MPVETFTPDSASTCPPDASEILPRLFQGDAHRLRGGVYDHVVSLEVTSARFYAVPEATTETVLGLSDTSMERHDEVAALIADTYRRWVGGQTILVRCAAGLNRSGLIVAGVLIADGASPQEAITTVRSRRHAAALGNDAYVAWLHSFAPAV